jgi:excisionase family DNA binding protein
MTEDREYLRAGEIARLTGTSVRTVRRWIADKMLPSTKLGGARLVAKADLEVVLSPSPNRLQRACGDAEQYDDDSEP